MKVGENRTVVPERRETKGMSLILLWLFSEGTLDWDTELDQNKQKASEETGTGNTKSS